MYINGKGGCVAVGAAGKNGEYKEVGENKTPLLKFSLAASKSGEKTTWFECQAWKDIAIHFKDKIKKGKSYFVCGEWSSRTYADKEYHTLNVQYIRSALPEVEQVQNAEEHSLPFVPEGNDDDFAVIGDDSLPF